MSYHDNMTLEQFAARHRDKFWIDEETGCWVWTGATNGNGYPRVSTGIKNKMMPAHRAFYEKKYGELSPDNEPHHKCKNFRCVNPDHMEPKTHQQNCELDLKKLTQQNELMIAEAYQTTSATT